MSDSRGGGVHRVAITHVPSPRMQEYEHTFVDAQAIDLDLAQRQHAAYGDALRRCGCDVTVLDVNVDMPDCVFVEDTAIVLDEVAVMMSPGAESRRKEPPGIERELSRYRPIARVMLPATIDGGDVVVAGRSIFVGRSERTNDEGVNALRDAVRPYGYTVAPIPVHGCLHLKTACSALPDGRFLVNADWIDVGSLPKDALLPVPAEEPWAGDVLVIGEQIVVSDAFPQTAALLGAQGWSVVPVSVSEFAKAEGGVTCLSLVFGV